MLEVKLININNGVCDVRVRGRIDTLAAPNFGREIDSIHAEHPDLRLKLDFSDVEILTSCGIRELLRFQKAGYDFFLQNVNSDVFFSLKLTGMTMLIDVRRNIPPISIEGCERIGAGANAEVYKLSGDTVVKVFTRSLPLDDIIEERMLAKIAFSAGIPTAISFGLTEVNGKPGLVFEMIDAKSIAKLVREDRSNIDRYAPQYAELLRDIHAVDCRNWNRYSLLNEADRFLAKVGLLAPYLREDCVEKLRRVGFSLADKHSLLHMDIQPNNVMVTGSELCLIDMDSIAQGAPEFELAQLMRSLILYWSLGDQSGFLGFDKAASSELWGGLLREYYHTEDESFLAEKERLFTAIGYCNILAKEVKRAGMSDRIEILKKLLEDACDHI